ncbi:MAG TPA: WbqC family protein [Chryseosolibacter sp.]
MNRRIAITQSNYIPWKGYFNVIRETDAFVLLDDVQYTRRDWRNRNLIKTQAGVKWLTIPVDVKGNYYIRIKDVQTANDHWRIDHWNAIQNAYKRSPYFAEYREYFENIYLGSKERNLSIINFNFIKLINLLLKIETPIHWSMDFDPPSGKTERLVHISKCLKASEYISGPAAKNYLDLKQFEENHIKVTWVDYSNYPVYRQLYEPFDHHVSIIDLLFNEGSNAPAYLNRI